MLFLHCNIPQLLQTYTVYYAFDPRDLEVGADPREKAKNISVTNKDQVKLTRLRACESYTAKIAMTSPGICPLSTVKTFTTGEGTVLNFSVLKRTSCCNCHFFL